MDRDYPQISQIKWIRGPNTDRHLGIFGIPATSGSPFFARLTCSDLGVMAVYKCFLAKPLDRSRPSALRFRPAAPSPGIPPGGDPDGDQRSR